jgi:general secretion pathway protein C
MKMHQASLFRSNLPQTSLVVLVTVAALLMLSTVAAYWTWNWLAPRPVLRALIVADTGGAPSSRVLFGNLRRDGNNVGSGASAVRLLGIVAAAGGARGYAVLQLEPRQILAVREGEDVAPGIRLAQVATNHVILERGGSLETLAWPEKGVAAGTAALRADKQ